MISLDQWTRNSADPKLLRKCKQAVREVVPEADVVLYGSRARGDAHADSDYDILILVDGPANIKLETEILDRVFPLEMESGSVITLALFSREVWNSPLGKAMPFYRNVDRDGVIV